jgi:hypothetical protein
MSTGGHGDIYVPYAHSRGRKDGRFGLLRIDFTDKKFYVTNEEYASTNENVDHCCHGVLHVSFVAD